MAARPWLPIVAVVAYGALIVLVTVFCVTTGMERSKIHGRVECTVERVFFCRVRSGGAGLCSFVEDLLVDGELLY
jgi:hypothetical protein